MEPDLDAFLAQSLAEHTHCRKCGRELVIVTVKDGRDRTTGEQTYRHYKECPRFRWGWTLFVGYGCDSRSVEHPMMSREWR